MWGETHEAHLTPLEPGQRQGDPAFFFLQKTIMPPRSRHDPKGQEVSRILLTDDIYNDESSGKGA